METFVPEIASNFLSIMIFNASEGLGRSEFTFIRLSYDMFALFQGFNYEVG